MSKAHHPAFPIQMPIDEMGNPTSGTLPGLTKRELFAAMAMQGILSKPVIFVAEPQTKTASFDALRATVAMDAVRNADALLAELAKGDA